jgi:nitrogen fixation protein FixH
MTPAKGELRGAHVLIGMLAFFAAVIAVNVAFAVVAVRTFPGEDVRRSYLQGLHYNDTLAERRAQAALGWRASAVLDANAEGAVLNVSLSAPDGRALDGLTLRGDLQWPTDSRLDHALTFEPLGGGVYAARLGELPSGRWRLRARAEDVQGRALNLESELAWPNSR